jgi:hypothetical protein
MQARKQVYNFPVFLSPKQLERSQQPHTRSISRLIANVFCQTGCLCDLDRANSHTFTLKETPLKALRHDLQYA